MNDSDQVLEDERNRAVDQEYDSREHQWDDAWPTTDAETSAHPAGEADVDNEVMPFPEVAGTYDVEEAVRDAEPYVPPTDPPVLPGGYEAVHVATGFGLDAEEEAARGGEPRGDFDIQEQALLMLQQDSLTSRYGLDADVNEGVVRITGRVPSLDDAEHAMAIVGELSGVVDVVDDTVVDPNMDQ
jgi:hypothetical protein